MKEGTERKRVTIIHREREGEGREREREGERDLKETEKRDRRVTLTTWTHTAHPQGERVNCTVAYKATVDPRRTALAWRRNQRRDQGWKEGGAQDGKV